MDDARASLIDPTYVSPSELDAHWGYVYLIWNRATGRVYVGQHRHRTGEEFYAYMGSGKGKDFLADRGRYGVACFGKRIVAFVSSPAEADLVECLEILRRRSQGERLYNIDEGGKYPDLMMRIFERRIYANTAERDRARRSRATGERLRKYIENLDEHEQAALLAEVQALRDSRDGRRSPKKVGGAGHGGDGADDAFARIHDELGKRWKGSLGERRLMGHLTRAAEVVKADVQRWLETQPESSLRDAHGRIFHETNHRDNPHPTCPRCAERPMGGGDVRSQQAATAPDGNGPTSDADAKAQRQPQSDMTDPASGEVATVTVEDVARIRRGLMDALIRPFATETTVALEVDVSVPQLRVFLKERGHSFEGVQQEAIRRAQENALK